MAADETAEWHRQMRRDSAADEVATWGRTFYPSVNAADTPEGVGYDGFRVLLGGEDVGRLGLQEERVSPGVGSLHVDSLWVRPDLRGRGVGRSLVDVAESEVRRRRLRSLELAVAAPNVRALRIYHAAGMTTWSQDRLVLADRLPDVGPAKVRTVVSAERHRVTVSRRGRRLGDVSLHRVERDGDVALAFPTQVRTGADLATVLAATGRDVVRHGIAALVVNLDAASSALLPDEHFPVRWHYLVKEV